MDIQNEKLICFFLLITGPVFILSTHKSQAWWKYIQTSHVIQSQCNMHPIIPPTESCISYTQWVEYVQTHSLMLPIPPSTDAHKELIFQPSLLSTLYRPHEAVLIYYITYLNPNHMHWSHRQRTVLQLKYFKAVQFLGEIRIYFRWLLFDILVMV